MRFRTLHTMYELDVDGKRIRRIASTHEPTPRQHDDGGWQPYVSITPVGVNSRVFIDWDGEGHGTLLSTVMEITEA